MKRGAAWLIGAAIGVALIFGASRGDVDAMTFGDGVFYAYVAQHLSATPSELPQVMRDRGPAYRYGRIGLPATVWLVSAGQRGAMRYAQPAVMVASAAAVAAAAVALFPALGLGVALAPFAALGFTLSIGGGFTEPLAVALALWAVVMARDHRWGAASVLMAAAMLTRETAVLVLAGACLWALIRTERRGAALMAASLLPVIAWHGIVAARFGHLPILDPYLRSQTAAGPFVSLWKGLTEFSGGVTVLVIVHALLAVVAIGLARRTLLGIVVAASAVQLVWVPVLTFRYFGDSVRTFVFVEMFAFLSLVEVINRRAVDREQAVRASQ